MRAMISGVVLSMMTAATSCSDTTPTTEAPHAPPIANAAAAIDAPRVPVEGMPALGDARALVTVVSFVDYECPFSARANENFATLRAKHGDDLRVVFANRPLPMHTHARVAALAALAAAEQGRFAELHARLFDATPGGEAAIVAAARAAGLDMPRWEAARNGEAMHKALMRSEELAQNLGVTGTPTSFVDGRRIEGAQPIDMFATVLADDLFKATALFRSGEPRERIYARLVKDAPIAPIAPEEVGAPCHAKDDAPAPDEVKAIRTDGAPMRGADDAKVSVVVFTDFQCPFCARLDGRLRELQTLYPDKVKVLYKAKPLPMHSSARLAAKAGVAAQAQGKFWALNDEMFAHQTSLDRAGLESHAAAAGLDMDRFRRDLDDPATNARVSADAQDADALGVTGTPTLFVNGRRLVGARPMTELVGAVERALAEAAR